MLRPRSTVVASQHQVSCKLGAEGTILHLNTGVYYGLNAVGARVWALLQQPVLVEQLRDQLFTQFAVQPEQLDRDLARLLDELAAEGLIEIRDEPAP